jgi:hypothetical protein
MALCISEKGARVVQLIRAVKAAGAMMPGDQVRMPGEKPAAYLGPLMERGIQMHGFRLFDGTEIVLEAPALNRQPGPDALQPVCASAGPDSQ